MRRDDPRNPSFTVFLLTLAGGAKSAVNVAWEVTHSVESEATPAFAWRYWTNVANWDDPPARFELLDGSFKTGSHGVTHIPGQEPLNWIVRRVIPRNAATIDIPLNGATLSFKWSFAATREGKTLLTQRIVLKGENANIYLPQVRAAFTANPPQAMQRLVSAMANAELRRKIKEI